MLHVEPPPLTTIIQPEHVLTGTTGSFNSQNLPIHTDGLQGRRYLPHVSNAQTSRRQYTPPINGEPSEDPELGKLRRQAIKYLEQVPWVSYLTHNTSLRNLLKRKDEEPTDLFMDQLLHVDMLNLASGHLQKLRTVKQLRDHFSYCKQEVTSRVYFVSVDDTPVQTLGLIGSFINIKPDVFALHMVTHPPLHLSLPSSLDAKSSLGFEYMSLSDGEISTQKMTFSVPSKDKDIWTGKLPFLLL
jgi:hypothetical protein